MVILGYRVPELARRTMNETLEDNVLGLAAQTAYNFFFSLFPLFLFIAPMLSLFGDKERIIPDLLARMSGFLPADALSLVSKVITDIAFTESAPGLISVGALLAAWSGSNIFTTFAHALNRAYDVTDERPWWKRRVLALAVMLGWALILIVVTGILMGGDQITAYARTELGLGAAATAWAIVQFPVALALLVAFLYLMYLLLPYVKQDKRHILVGSFVAALLFVAATLLFRLYVQNFGAYNKTYGTVGAVIMLLTWMYVVSVVILVGGELNSELHAGTGSTASLKGSVYAGRIATGEQPSQPSSKIE
ncbi:MAG TPA: YihY/virulence factor BrkB family protein [Gemmatimonadaceae bacterium]|nr:YihY/virulence factor BrkB family protein [Gemmatimonadaceae bacterium]